MDTWGPFVFVNPDPEAAPLADTLGDLPAVVAENGLDVDALRFHHRVAYEIHANWKIAIENYLECYHCQLNHPDLVHVIDEQAQRQETRGLRLSQFPPLQPDALEPGNAPYDVQRRGAHRAVPHPLPGDEVQRQPGPAQPVDRPDVADGGTIAPSAWFDYFFAEGTDEAWIEEMLEFDNQVGSEDTALVEAVQRGAGSGALPHGRLLTRTEVLIGAFQELVRGRVEPALRDADSA